MASEVKRLKTRRDNAFKCVAESIANHMADIAEGKDVVRNVTVESSVKDLFVWIIERLFEEVKDYDGNDPNDYLIVMRHLAAAGRPVASYITSVLPPELDPNIPEDVGDYMLETFGGDLDEEKEAAGECVKAVMIYGKQLGHALAAQCWPSAKKITLHMAIAGMRIMGGSKASPSLFREAYDGAKAANAATAAKKKA